MKKLFAVALALVLSVGIFAGCNASRHILFRTRLYVGPGRFFFRFPVGRPHPDDRRDYLVGVPYLWAGKCR